MENMNKPLNFEIIVGTYEEFVVGYRFNLQSETETELIQTFASHSHNSSVRCVTHSEHYLASGGADDRIVIYDLKSRKEHCMLTHHYGTVNCLQFTEGHTHLISGGSDGMLAITRVGNWQIEKVWEKAHKGASIIDIAIHPSSKLALSLGADNTLRTWNLVKGRQAYVINLNSKSKDPKSLQFIRWAPDGVRFVLCGGFHSDIWSIETGGVINAMEHENKVSYCLFYDDDTLAVCFENGELVMLDLNQKSSKQVKAHSVRIKSLDLCKGYLITCSSNGEVKIWNRDLDKIASCNTGCRNTSMCVILPTWIKKEENENLDEELKEVCDLSKSSLDDENVIKHKKVKKSFTVEEDKIELVDKIPEKKEWKPKEELSNEQVLINNKDMSNHGNVLRHYSKNKKTSVQKMGNEQIIPRKKKKKSKIICN